MTTPPDPAQPGTGYGGAQYPPPGDPQYPSGQNPPGQYPPGQYSPNQYPPTQINPGQAPPAEPGYATGYGGARYPLPAGQEQPQPGGYAYNPYGPYGQGPAGLDDKELPPATRPGIMVLSLVLLALSALPFLFFGAVVLLVPLDGNVIPPEVFDNPQVAASGLTQATLIAVIRGVGVAFLVLALLYVLFAVFSFLGHNWARILLTVMTVGFSLLLVLSLTSGGATDPASAAIILVPLLLAVGGTVLLYAAPAREYFSARRR